MNTPANIGGFYTADMDNHNKAGVLVGDILAESQDPSCELTQFLIKHKTSTPICTALVSQDLKTLHFISQSIFKLDIAGVNKKSKSGSSSPYEIIKARLYLTAESMVNVEILSVRLQALQRFCLIFNDNLTTREGVINNDSESATGEYAFSFRDLTPREKEIARMVAHGKTSVKVAKELNIAIDTVKNHRKNIRRKLKIATRAEQMKVNEWLRNTQPATKIVL